MVEDVLRVGKEVTIECAECGAPYMIIRENSHNKTRFLGCPNYPQCRGTRPITEELRMRALGQKGLFDNL